MIVYMGTDSSLLNIRPIIFSVVYCFLLFFSYPSEAASTKDLSFRGYYKCTFSGINFAKLGIHAEQDSHSYAVTSDITLTGIAKLFTKHSSHTTVDASGKNYVYSSSEYESNYKTKNKKRYVKITYKGEKFGKETLDPPENPAKRTPVPIEEKNESYDPLSGLLSARAQLIDALENGNKTFSLNIYDGRRLTQVDFTILGERVIRMDDRKVPVITVQAKRTLLAGFTNSELADHDPKEAPLLIHFSNDETLFPVRLEAHLMFGSIVADLHKTCSTQESCLLGIKE